MRLHAYGTVDELNAVIGVVLAESEAPKEVAENLKEVQRLLFRVGADLATPKEGAVETDGSASLTTSCIEEKHVLQVEEWIDSLDATLPSLQRFILPSGSRAGSLLHLARTVCRRAERWIVSLDKSETISPHLKVYMNRLGDYLFVAARTANKEAGMEELEVR